jgi:hypothetical protein
VTRWQAVVSGQSTRTAGLLCRGIAACVISGFLAIAALAQTPAAQEVTVTLLPSQFSSLPATPEGYLRVTDAGANFEGAAIARTASWLYFDASALPPENAITITRAQLQLTRANDADLANLPPDERQQHRILDRGTFIRLLSAPASSAGGAAPANYNDGTELTRMQSDRRTCPEPLRCSDSAKWTVRPPGNAASPSLVRQGSEGTRYIGLLLVPSDRSASSRVYFGLRTGDQGKAKDSEAGYQPRLILTYRYNAQPSFGCTSEPLTLANLQSEGGQARISGCEFISKENSPSQDKYAPQKIADDSLTVTPAVYGDLIFVVRNDKWSECPGPDAEKPQGTDPEAVCLEARKPLGGVVWKTWVDGKGMVLSGSRMVVNRFGLLRIVTGSAIYSFQLQLKQNCPEIRTKKAVDFGAPPAQAVEGPDGTLYLVSKGIIALNPDYAPVDQAGYPRKLWWRTLGNAASADAKITLSADGQFLYALALFSDESKFLAINARTGKDVDLNYEAPDSNLPAKLLTLYNPVVAKDEDGADYVFIAGNLGTKGVLRSVRNKPVMTLDGDNQAKLTTVWTMDEAGAKIGQPILDSIADKPADFSSRKLYFLISRSDASEFRAVGAGNGKMVASSSKEVISTCTIDREKPMSLGNGNWYCVEDFGVHSGAYLYDFAPSGGVDTDGNVLTSVRFVDFSSVYVGQEFSVGSSTCTVTAVESPTKLTCKENLGNQKNVAADIPLGKVNTEGHLVMFAGGYGIRHTWGGTERIGIRGTPLPANISIDGNPVVDSAGNVMFWANDTFYGFTAQAKQLFSPQLPELGKAQLLFGPGGTLYAASGATVNALVPSFNLDALGNGSRKIKSPTSLLVTGTATTGAPWELEARGSIIRGSGFQVQNGAVVKEKITGETSSLSELGDMPCACANPNAPPPGTVVTWTSGRKFDQAVVGQQIGVGLELCTVATKTGNTSLTCKENLEESYQKRNLRGMPTIVNFGYSPARVDTEVTVSGTFVHWKGGKKFHEFIEEGEAGDPNFVVGYGPCTIAQLASNYTMRCKEQKGNESNILAYHVEGQVSTSSPPVPNPPVCK